MALNPTTLTAASEKAKEVATLADVPTSTSGTVNPTATTEPLGSTYHNITDDSMWTYTASGWVQGGDPDALTDANFNTNITTIDGGKITTGFINANRIDANTVNASNLLVNQTVRSSGFTAIGGAGFRLKANAAGTTADPTIYGAYIRAGTLQASLLYNDSLKVVTSNGNTAPFAIANLATVTGTSSGTYYSGTLQVVSAIFSTGYLSNRLVSTTSPREIIAYKNLAYHRANIAIQRSTDGGGWTTIKSGSNGEGGDILTVLDVTNFTNYVGYRVKLWVDGGNNVAVTATIVMKGTNYQ